MISIDLEYPNPLATKVVQFYFIFFIMMNQNLNFLNPLVFKYVYVEDDFSKTYIIRSKNGQPLVFTIKLLRHLHSLLLSSKGFRSVNNKLICLEGSKTLR